jgi:hypothetical protein
MALWPLLFGGDPLALPPDFYSLEPGECTRARAKGDYLTSSGSLAAGLAHQFGA